MLRKQRFTDEEIVQSIFNADKNESKSIEFILNSNRKQIKSFVLKNNGGANDAEVILVEGVTQLIFNIRKGKFKGESKLSTYLYTICKRMWLKSLKKESRYIDFESNYSESLDESASPLAIFSEKELVSEVDLLLNKVGEACKKVLKLWAMHYSMHEIAQKMEYKNAQVSMNKKNRCLTKLKSIVQESTLTNELLNNYLGA